VRLLLDECVPRPLKRDLVGHDVQHVVDMGWSSKRNGDLLKLKWWNDSKRFSPLTRTWSSNRTFGRLELVSFSSWRERTA
jgi:hypothetical protein